MWVDTEIASPSVPLQECREYCFSDVMLLAEGCTKFGDAFVEVAGVDPLFECTTIASAALRSYRRRFMREDSVMIDRPECLKLRQSKVALTYFAWLRQSEGLVIRDAANGGEKKVASDEIVASITSL